MAQDWSQNEGEQGSEIDGEVEPGKVRIDVILLLGQLELFGAKGRDAGLDAASSQGNEDQADKRQWPEKS